MLWSLILGCSLIGPVELGEYEDVRKVPFPVAAVTNFDTSNRIVDSWQGELVGTIPFATHDALYFVEARTGGFDEDLLPLQPTMPRMFRMAAPEDDPVEIPLPPPFDGMDRDAALEVYAELNAAQAVTTFDPQALALAWGEATYYFDGTSWSTLPVEGYGAWAVFPDRVVLDSGEVRNVDGTTAFWEVAFQERLGPLREDGVWVAYTVGFEQRQVCADIMGFDGTRTLVDCIDFDFWVDFGSELGGTPDQASVLLRETRGDATWARWIRFTESGVGIEEWPDPGESAWPNAAPPRDLVNDASVAWRPNVWLIPETAERYSSIGPAAMSHPCDEPAVSIEDRSEPWCLEYTIVPEWSASFEPDVVWGLLTDTFDMNRDRYINRVVGQLEPGQTVPLVDLPVSRSGPVDIPVLPGFGPIPAECVEVRDGDGNLVEPDANGDYELFFTETYTLEYLACDLGDGGPPVMAESIAIEPQTPELLNFPREVGRAWALDPADSPPLQRFVRGIPTLVVRENTGWNALSVDGSGMQRLPLGPAGDPEPKILPGPWFLTASGELISDDTTVTLPLNTDPADTRWVADRYLVEDTATHLRVHDLGVEPPATIIDETLPRDREFIATNPSGTVVVERDALGWVEARQRGTGTVTRIDAYPASAGIFADVSESGALIVVSSDQGGFGGAHVADARIEAGVVTVSEVCGFCGPHAFLEEAGERYVYGLQTHLRDDNGSWTDVAVDGLNLGRVELPRRIDPYGWVWVDATVSAVNLRDSGQTAAVPVSWSGSSWSGPYAQEWYQLTSPGTMTAVTPPVWPDPAPLFEVVGPGAPGEPEVFDLPCRVVESTNGGYGCR